MKSLIIIKRLTNQIYAGLILLESKTGLFSLPNSKKPELHEYLYTVGWSPAILTSDDFIRSNEIIASEQNGKFTKYFVLKF